MNNGMNQTAKAGGLLCITSGCYSDYDVIGFFVVLRDFSPGEQREKMRADMDVDNFWEEQNAFLSFLVSQGFLLEIEYSTLHFGDYLRLSDAEFHPRNGPFIPEAE